MRKLWDDKEAASRAVVEKGGANIIIVDKKPFQDAMKPVYDKFITDPKMKDMVAKIQASN
jgi:TRAP-type C4-dicarboxylate transport system substrate-binding protein